MEDKASFETGSEPPPPMDEAWWASVLSEDPRQAVAEELSHERPISPGSSQPGSIEDWLWARELFEADDTVDLTVIGSNRGGLLVAARSLRGFVPVSHLVSVDQASNPSFSADQLADLVGKELCLKVIEFDPQRGRLVLSERAAQAGPGKRIELLESLKTGDRCHGKVTNITRFGVFVD
ncbi:MAG: S1 RNA-binding domain-containing protein, partial [Anaerolineae bacterium]|nr:S1 RNA-binding domain-containing protein [Anaerolineae bacterium]